MTMDAAEKLSRRALLRGRRTSPGSEGPSFAASCLARSGILCRTCGDICPEGAIRFPPQLGGVGQPWLDAERCTRCGECVAVCPVGAVSLGAEHAA
ncbi:MAG: 4Fe-4S binding protein [Geminicoccaceae bacterium]